MKFYWVAGSFVTDIYDTSELRTVYLSLWIADPHSSTAKKNSSHGNEVLPQDTMHLIQRPRYQRGSLYQDPAGNRTTLRPLDHRKETQTEVVWTCLPFIRSSHLARHSEMGKKTRQTEKNVGRQHQETDKPGVRQRAVESQRAVENREKWRKLVVKSSVEPLRPPRLRYRQGSEASAKNK